MNQSFLKSGMSVTYSLSIFDEIIVIPQLNGATQRIIIFLFYWLLIKDLLHFIQIIIQVVVNKIVNYYIIKQN